MSIKIQRNLLAEVTEFSRISRLLSSVVFLIIINHVIFFYGQLQVKDQPRRGFLPPRPVLLQLQDWQSVPSRTAKGKSVGGLRQSYSNRLLVLMALAVNCCNEIFGRYIEKKKMEEVQKSQMYPSFLFYRLLITYACFYNSLIAISRFSEHLFN